MISAAEFKPTVLFYHHPCSDGFTAAWVARRYDPAIRLVPYDHDDPVPQDVAGERVAMIDCCFPRDLLLQLRARVHDLLVLDHHQSSAKACGDLPFCHFEQERSGAGLAWAFFYPHKAPPLLVTYVQDQDLHTRKYQETRDFIPALYRHGLEFRWWDYMGSLHRSDEQSEQLFLATLREGAVLREHFSHLMEEMASRSSPATLFGYRVRYANAPNPFHSAVANCLAYRDSSIDFGLSFAFEHLNRVRVSLRSRATGMDLHEVASRLGGGGHAHAAGAIMQASEFFQLFS